MPHENTIQYFLELIKHHAASYKNRQITTGFSYNSKKNRGKSPCIPPTFSHAESWYFVGFEIILHKKHQLCSTLTCIYMFGRAEVKTNSCWETTQCSSYITSLTRTGNDAEQQGHNKVNLWRSQMHSPILNEACLCPVPKDKCMSYARYWADASQHRPSI